MKIPVINKSGTPSGFYQDANGRWHRPMVTLHQMQKLE